MRYSQNMRDSDFSVLVGIKNCRPVIFDAFWSFSSFLSGPVVSKTATETLWNSSEVFLSVTDGSVTRVYITCSHMTREYNLITGHHLKKQLKVNSWRMTRTDIWYLILTFVDPHQRGPRSCPNHAFCQTNQAFIQHGRGSKIRDRVERSRSVRNWLRGSVLRRGKRRRKLP